MCIDVIVIKARQMSNRQALWRYQAMTSCDFRIGSWIDQRSITGNVILVGIHVLCSQLLIVVF